MKEGRRLTPPPQPRHHQRVDPDRAWAETGAALIQWATARACKSAPFSGGVLDSWPAWATDAWPVLDAELIAVEARLSYEERRD